MANFQPLKRSILFCLKQLIARHDLQPGFLDVGCGIGDVSVFLAGLGWTGKAIDISEAALAEARRNLGSFPGVRVELEDFFESGGTYGTVVLFDILEHLADDAAALRKLSSLVRSDGHAVIAVPSNPRLWGWDDDFYGHFRRYTEEEILPFRFLRPCARSIRGLPGLPKPESSASNRPGPSGAEWCRNGRTQPG